MLSIYLHYIKVVVQISKTDLKTNPLNHIHNQWEMVLEQIVQNPQKW